MSHVFVVERVKAASHLLQYLSIADSIEIVDEDLHTNMEPFPHEAKTDGLVFSQVKQAVDLVKCRRQRASDRYQELGKRYQAISEEDRMNKDIAYEYREECHSEFASPGMYDGVLSLLGQNVKEAEGELARSDLEGCFESLRGVMQFLHPMEKQLVLYGKAMLAHEEVAKKSAEKVAKKNAKKRE